MSDLYNYKAVVVKVYDGDTVYLDIDLGFDVWLKNFPISLADVSAPQLSRNDNSDADILAKAGLETLLPVGKRVQISTNKKADKHGKYYAIFQFEDDTINEIMVKAGLVNPIH